MAIRPLISVVDDDISVRESLPDLLRVSGFDAQAFASAEAYMASDCIDQTCCLVVDVSMPGMTGPDLHRELVLRKKDVPIIFITANVNPTLRQHLIDQGAKDCLFKPFNGTILIDAISGALEST
jgi:FixJ family two-component response regulator